MTANIIRIKEYKNKDTIEVCEEIIRRAKDGRVHGMIYTIDEGAGFHGVGATGTYRANPVEGRAIAGALFDLFSKLSKKFTSEDEL